jgi:hypothetical protein
MTANFRRSAVPLITTIQKLFSEDLAKENDFLRRVSYRLIFPPPIPNRVRLVP